MPEEKLDQPPSGEQHEDEEEEAWGRLSPRLRGLIREELDEAEKRRKPVASPSQPDKPAGDPPAQPTTEEKPTSDGNRRPRRTAAELWFGGRRASSD